jgi:hypothetical protein
VQNTDRFGADTVQRQQFLRVCGDQLFEGGVAGFGEGAQGWPTDTIWDLGYEPTITPYRPGS